MSASPWMTLPEACTYTRHSRQTVRRAAVENQRDNTKGLRGYQTHAGASWRFHADDLDRWVRGEPPARTTRQLASVRTA